MLPRKESRALAAISSCRSTSRGREGVERWALDAVEPGHDRPDDEEHPELRALQRCVEGEDSGAEGEGGLGDLDEAPPVEGVRERSADEGGHEQWAELGEAEEADDERRAGELVRLVRQRDVRDHRAEERDALAEEEQAEVAVPLQRPDVDRRELEGRTDAPRLRHGRGGPEALGLAEVVSAHRVLLPAPKRKQETTWSSTRPAACMNA